MGFDFPNRLPFVDALGLGGIVTLAGVLIVFLGLVSLIVLTIVYPKVFGWILPPVRSFLDKMAAKRAKRRIARLEKKAAIKAASLTVTAETQAASPVISKSQAPTVDGALVAAITAAIAASMGTSSNGIRIRSLRRSGTNTPAWGREGKLEQFRF